MKVEYSSNNSGGYWWLKDEDWLALEKAGWSVQWAKDKEGYMYNNGRYMGALAKYAEFECESLGEAIKSFEEVTGQDASDEGCNCCGPPHNFSGRDENEEYHYASGEGCLEYLYDNVPSSLREAVEKLNNSSEQTITEEEP